MLLVYRLFISFSSPLAWGLALARRTCGWLFSVEHFLALFGLGTEAPRFELVWREPPLPWGYVLCVIAAVMLLEIIPYVEEFIRGLRANKWKLVRGRRTSSTKA